jgi:hypothetical protein
LLERQLPVDATVHVGDIAYAFEMKWKVSAWFSMMQRVLLAAPYMIIDGNRDFEEVQTRFRMPYSTDGALWYTFDLVRLRRFARALIAFRGRSVSLEFQQIDRSMQPASKDDGSLQRFAKRPK